MDDQDIAQQKLKDWLKGVVASIFGDQGYLVSF